MLARETDEQIRVWPGHTNNYFVFQNNNDTGIIEQRKHANR